MSDGTEVLDPKARKLADAFVDTWKTTIRPELKRHNVGYFMIAIYPDDDPGNDEQMSGGNAMGVFTNVFLEDQERILRDTIVQINTPEYRSKPPSPIKEN